MFKSISLLLILLLSVSLLGCSNDRTLIIPLNQDNMKTGVFAYLPSYQGYTTTIVTAEVYYPISGIFNNTYIENFYINVSIPAIVYNNSHNRQFKIDWVGNIESSKNNVYMHLCLNIDGVLINESCIGNFLETANEEYVISGLWVQELEPLDSVQLVVTSDSSGDILTFEHFKTSVSIFGE